MPGNRQVVAASVPIQKGRKKHPEIPFGGDKRGAYLGRVAIEALTELIKHGESDDLKYRAACSLLDLPMVKAKMEALAATVKPPPVDKMLERRIRRLVEGGSTQSQEVLRLIEEAEKEASVQPESGLAGVNLLKGKETP